MSARIWLALLAAPALFAATVTFRSDGPIVHEWGTFTSVADEDGASAFWFPLSGPSDLPCFVHRLGGLNLKRGAAAVRMETPVIYFYAPRPLSVSVRVDFPQGLITEWYPRASSVEPANSGQQARLRSRMEWTSVEVHPGTQLEYPVQQGASHYYAARDTDSAALRIGNEQEKLIFYRGMGNFSIPLRPRVLDNNRIDVVNAGQDPVAEVILFENRAGKVGYRRSRDLRNRVTLPMPELTASVAAVIEELEQILISQGLYAKEARAMLETWRDSWFEEGTRILYIVPRPMVDSVLPLDITPAPAATVRTFVGRVEVLSPSMEESLEQALATDDVKTLERYSRFVQPWFDRISKKQRQRVDTPRIRTFLNSAYARTQADWNAPRCSQ